MTTETAESQGSRDLANFIIDLKDEDCPQFELHLAAYQGDIPRLKELLLDEHYQKVRMKMILWYLLIAYNYGIMGGLRCIQFYIFCFVMISKVDWGEN